MKFLFLVLSFFSGFAVADLKDFYYERFLERQKLQTWGASSLVRSEPSEFVQKVNPADPSDTRTFKQRYFVNTQFAESKNSPTLFFLCGEATCKGVSGVMSSYASQLKANLIALEHRYYGKSQPFDQLTAENLKYLSTDNALKDAAEFQKFAMETLGFKGKWIVVGGSYAGSLAAYYRQQYPELVVGALSSSGPVRAEANFEVYDKHVAQVAGPECLADIKKVVAQLESSLSNPKELENIKAKFSAEKLENEVDFVYLVADMAALAIQYGYRDHFCELLKTKSPLEGYSQFTQEIYQSWGINALSGSAAGAVSLDPADYLDQPGGRQWFYQSCTEYGYWQNAYHDSALSARSPLINSDYHNGICRRLFGIETPIDTSHINQTFYLPLLLQETTRIFFSNGSRDPWMNLSIAIENGNHSNQNTPVMTIEGSAHCDDLRAPKASDSGALKKAREQFLDLAKDWLEN